MGYRNPGAIGAKYNTAYTVIFSLTVEDVPALWSAAANRALSMPGTTLDDVMDTIGSREDPSIEDCLSMLVAPAPIAGCLLEDFDIRAAPFDGHGVDGAS